MRWPWQRNNPDEEIQRELEAHLALEAKEQTDAGRSTLEGRWAAQRALGNLTLIKEETRMVWLSPWWEQFAQDLHYAMRQLRLSPGFTVVATLSPAFGIGANTALFQLVDAIRLRTLPVTAPEELALIKYSGEASISGAYTGRNESLTHPQF